MKEEALLLNEEEQELLASELASLIPALDERRKGQFLALATAVQEGAIPQELLPALEGLLALALETGRARLLYRAEGERIFTDLFRRTPKGQELGSLLEEVNRALMALKGRTLTGVRVAMRTLGHYTITLETEEATVTLAVKPQGVNLESLAVGT